MSSTMGDKHTNHSAVAVITDASAFTCTSSAPFGQRINAVSVCKQDPKASKSTPYMTGFTFTAWRLCPPAPFGCGYDTPLPALHPDPAAVSHEELCTSRQPLEGQTQHEFEEKFTINSTLRTGVGRGPQLVVVNDAMVAKIYDPMFYEPDKHTDVF